MKASFYTWFLFVFAVTTSSLFFQTTNLFADVDDPLELTDDDYSKDRIARLIQLLDDKDPQVRGEAAENLPLLGSEARDAISKMLTLTDDKGRYSVYFIPCVVGNTVTSSLVTMAPESILPLQQRFTKLSSDAQWKIVSQITNAKANVSPLLPQLIQMLEVTKKDNRSRHLLFLTIAAADPNGKQTFPLLLKTLREDKDETARQYAAIALSRAESLTQVYWNQRGPAARWFRDSPLDAAAAAEALLAALSDKSPAVRAAAAQSLITYPESGASAVDGLVRLLDDKGLYSVMYSNHVGGQQSVSQSAKMCLIQFDQQADRVLRLIIQFDDWEIEAKQQAIARLVPHCKQPLDQLRIMLDGEHPYLALRAVAVLGPAAKPLIPRLEALTHDKNVANAEEAKSTLGFIAPKQFPAYADKLKQLGKNLQHALSFATDMGPQASFAVPTLLKHLREGDELKMDVARALGSIGPDAIEAAPIFIDSLESDYTFNMDETEGLLVQFGPGVVSLIVPILKNPEKKQKLRVACLRVLARIGPPAQDAIPAIMDELNSKYPRVREAAVQAIGAIASAEDRSLAALKKAMTDPRPFVRGAAAESYVTLGVKTTPLVPDLIELLSDEYLEVRLASISALGRLGPTAIAAELPIKKLLLDKDIQVRDASKAALLSIRRAKQ